MTVETPSPNQQPEDKNPNSISNWLKKVLPKGKRTESEKAIGEAKYAATTYGWSTLETGGVEDAAKKPEGGRAKEDGPKPDIEQAKAMLDDIRKPGGEMSEQETEAMYSSIGEKHYEKVLAQGKEIREMWKNKLEEEARAETVKMSPEELTAWNKLRAEIEEKHGAEISILIHPNESIKDVIRRHIISFGLKKEEHGRGRFGEKGEWIDTPAGEEAMTELILAENPELLTFDMYQPSDNKSEEPATARVLVYTKNDEFILIGGERGEQMLAKAPRGKNIEDTPHELLATYDKAIQKGGTKLRPPENITELTDEAADFPTESTEEERGYALHGGEIKFKGGKNGEMEKKTSLGGMKTELDLKDKFVLDHNGKEVVAVFNPKKGEYYNALNPRERVQVFHGDKIKPYREFINIGYAFNENGVIHFSDKKAEREVTLGEIKTGMNMPDVINVIHGGEEILANYDAATEEYVDILGARVKIHDGDKIKEYNADWHNAEKITDNMMRKIA